MEGSQQGLAAGLSSFQPLAWVPDRPPGHRALGLGAENARYSHELKFFGEGVPNSRGRMFKVTRARQPQADADG